ncbi:MAG: hypothetical protein JJLCMIEE_02314 [Acidimicrobiales bacterium]|nr:hypothetical protein [Acidimicrobiales bacterium]
MDLFGVIKVVWRRWYVALPLLVLTVVATLVSAATVAPDYAAEGSVLLVSPLPETAETTDTTLATDEADPFGTGDTTAETSPADPASENPLLVVPGGVTSTAQALQLAMTSSDFRQEVDAAGFYSDYEIEVESRSPIINFYVTGSDAELVVETLDHLVGTANDKLAEVQLEAGATENALITSQLLAMDSEAAPDYGSRTKMAIVVAVIGLVVTVGVPVAMEGISQMRRRSAGADQSDQPVLADEHKTQPAATVRVTGDITAHHDGTPATRPERSAGDAPPVAESDPPYDHERQEPAGDEEVSPKGSGGSATATDEASAQKHTDARPDGDNGSNTRTPSGSNRRGRADRSDDRRSR